MQVEDYEEPELERGRPKQPKPQSGAGAFKEVVITVAAALILAWGMQAFLVKPYRIPSGSMENTLRCSDRVLVDRVSYRFSDPDRGDIIVFQPPAYVDGKGRVDIDALYEADEDQLEAGTIPHGEQTPAETNFIKRIVGMPGETVEIRDGTTFINGEELKEPYLHPNKPERDQGPFIVPDGTYFMMGDNRNNSHDSRWWGPLPEDYVIGKAFMIYWPMGNFGTIPEEDPGGPTAPDENCIDQSVSFASGVSNS